MIKNCVTIVCLFVLMIVGCSSGPEESVKTFVSNTKKQTPEPIIPLPQLSSIEGILYEASHLRSPFEPAIVSLLDKPAFVEQPKSLLEYYPLDSLRMVGTLVRKNKMSALIRDKSGWIHRVDENDRIGQHSGKIVTITESAIEVVEWVVDNEGKWIERSVPINLI